MNYKNRGHFCNYCRKIIWNKISVVRYISININEAIWYAWDHPETHEQFVAELKALDTSVSNKAFNGQLKALMRKYRKEEST